MKKVEIRGRKIPSNCYYSDEIFIIEDTNCGNFCTYHSNLIAWLHERSISRFTPVVINRLTEDGKQPEMHQQKIISNQDFLLKFGNRVNVVMPRCHHHLAKTSICRMNYMNRSDILGEDETGRLSTSIILFRNRKIDLPKSLILCAQKLCVCVYRCIYCQIFM